MKIAPTLRISLRALRRNKMRSLLTMLGIIIGVGAVIAMVGIGSGARSQVEAQIASLGTNMILIFSGSMTSGGARSGWGGSGTLKVEDALAIEREVPGVLAVSPEVRSGAQVTYGNQNWGTGLTGAGERYFEMREWPFTSGACFTEQDVRSAAKVAVIGQTTATQLFGDEDPVGKVIRVRNVPFLITGLAHPKGLSFTGRDQDDMITMPYTTAMKRLTGDTKLSMISVKTVSEEATPQVEQDIIALLRQRHQITGTRDDDFTVRTQQEIAEMATATQTTLRVLLLIIACVSLVVGGIGIMNIMLVSVTERTREIGIRMAVGAHGSDIMLQFLIESVTLSALGGLIGIVLGIATSRLVTIFKGWPTQISPTVVMLSFGFSAAIGVFFGLYPARKAAALDPIDALRYE